MNISSILGTFGIIIGLVRAMPQLGRLLRARKAYGVSVDTAATSAIVSLGWATYGVLTDQFYISFASGLTGIIFALITFFALHFGRRVKEFKVAPIWLAVLLLAGISAGKNGLGLVLPVSVLAANIPQLRLAYRESNLSDLSLGTWLLSMAEGLIWVTYSFLQQDFSIMVSAIFQVVTSGLIVALKLAHQAKNQKQVGLSRF